MNKKTLNKLKENLEKERANIEKALRTFADKDKNMKGDWDTRFPKWDGDSGSSAMERAADQVEEYSTLLSVEHSLENKLKDINSALDRIRKGKYGKCEECGKEIAVERLKAYPEAKTCSKCQNK